MYVSISIVRAVADELRRRGVSTDQFCREAGLRPEELLEGSRQIRMDRYIGAMRAAGRLAKDPTFGLKVGASAPVHTHLVSYLGALCSTMREGLALLEKYGDLVFEGARFELQEDGNEARFTFDHPGRDPAVLAAEAEGYLAFLVAVGQAFAAGHPPWRVRFAHSMPPHADLAEYRRTFGCEVEFGASVNQLVFDRKGLDVQHVHRDEHLCQTLKQHLDREMAHRHDGSDFLRRVRDLLRYDMDFAQAGAQEIAKRLGISRRALQRRLHDHGARLSDLVDEARRDSACAALADPGLTIKEIAERLGFSEASAFHRAFKRWTGLTPQQYRDSLE